MDELVAGELRVRRAAEEAHDAVCLRLEGQLDAASALPLARVLLDAQRMFAGTVVLDLARLSFLDVCGVRVLVDAARRAWSSGGELQLRSPSPSLCRLFRLVGLSCWAELGPDGAVAATLPPEQRLATPRFGRELLH